MAIVDRHGLPLSVSMHAANHHQVRLVQLGFDFNMIEAKLENLIGLRKKACGGNKTVVVVAGKATQRTDH